MTGGEVFLYWIPVFAVMSGAGMTGWVFPAQYIQQIIQPAK